MQDNITETLAKFVSQVRFEDLPKEVVHETKRITLDIIGCALGSLDLDKGRIALEFARRTGGPKEATILGTGEKVASPIAAFANAELMHTMDYCPILAPGHVTPYVTAAPIALAEVKNASGKALITAIAIAHEVASRVGVSLGPMRAAEGYPAPSWGLSADTFGAAVGAGKILGFDRVKMADTLGLAGYFAPVPSHTKFLYTPYNGMAKYGPAGWIAQGGVTTAILAEIGYSGDREVLDGEYGFWMMNGSRKEAVDLTKITAGLGKDWMILRVCYKYWPCCGLFQSPLTAFTKLIDDYNLRPEEIEEIFVRSETFAGFARYRATDIHNQIDAQASMPYNLAVAAHRVKVGPEWQLKSTIENPSIQRLMKKYRWEHYPKTEETRYQELVVEGKPYITRRPSMVQVTARSQVFTQDVEYAKWISAGNPEFRATDEGLADKFRANTEKVLNGAKMEKAIETIFTLEEMDDVSALTKLLREN